MRGVHFDQNGIEVRWQSVGDGRAGGVRISVTDELTKQVSHAYIEELEVMKELIEVLEKLRDS